MKTAISTNWHNHIYIYIYIYLYNYTYNISKSVIYPQIPSNSQVQATSAQKAIWALAKVITSWPQWWGSIPCSAGIVGASNGNQTSEIQPKLKLQRAGARRNCGHSGLSYDRNWKLKTIQIRNEWSLTTEIWTCLNILNCCGSNWGSQKSSSMECKGAHSRSKRNFIGCWTGVYDLWMDLVHVSFILCF